MHYHRIPQATILLNSMVFFGLLYMFHLRKLLLCYGPKVLLYPHVAFMAGMVFCKDWEAFKSVQRATIAKSNNWCSKESKVGIFEQYSL